MSLEKLITLVAILVSYFLQSSVDFFRLWDINPDFLLILTIYFSLTRGTFAGLWVGFLGGLLQDINLGGIAQNETINFFIGTHALPKALIGYTVGKMSHELEHRSPLIVFVLLLATGFAKGIITFLEIAIFHTGISPQTILTILFPETIYTAVLATIWFRLLSWAMPPVPGRRV